jgi:hypothetical protein
MEPGLRVAPIVVEKWCCVRRIIQLIMAAEHLDGLI